MARRVGYREVAEALAKIPMDRDDRPVRDAAVKALRQADVPAIFLCQVCDQTPERGHAPDCPGSVGPRAACEILVPVTADELKAFRELQGSLGLAEPADLVRVALYNQWRMEHARRAGQHVDVYIPAAPGLFHVRYRKDARQARRARKT